jgi:hypothetical protein
MRLLLVSLLHALSIAVASATASGLLARQNAEDNYLSSVCLPPNVTNPVPPCIEIIGIEEACAPNGTAPIDLLAHAECMCNGGYFSNWIGCLNCDFVHGGRSPQLTSAFHTILSSAFNALCTGTPSASFAAIFSSIQDVANPGDATATGLSDQFPSRTDVSLYYTATGPQGLGAITGSATLATKAADTSVSNSGPTTSVSTGVKSSGTGSAGTGSATGANGASSLSSTGGVARQTGFAAGGFVAMAGAALVVAL